MVRTHYPMPSMIANAFSSILFSNRPSFTIDSGSKARDKKHTERLEEIFAVNDILSLLQESAQLQSYSGGVAFKINLDSTLTDVPLITAYPREKYNVHKKFGQIVYIDFFDEFEKYTLRSRYGRGYISYTLFMGTKEVNLNVIPQTADLKDIAFMDTERNLIPFIFATEIPNKGHGHSDYQGLTTSFHALDETYSSMVNYIRKTKPHIFITEDLVQKDAFGKPERFNEFDTVITMLDSTPDGTATQINREDIGVNVDGYLETFNALRNIILQKAGISPSTLGIESGGANASGEALNIRERASARTRTEKLSVWSERMDEFIYSLLLMDEIASDSTMSEGFVVVENMPDFVVKSDFGSFHEKSMSEKVSIYKEAIASKLMSVRQGVEMLYGETLSEEEQMKLVIEIKLENGLNLTSQEQEFMTLNMGAAPE